jgi:hypothetical protein
LLENKNVWHIKTRNPGVQEFEEGATTDRSEAEI